MRCFIAKHLLSYTLLALFCCAPSLFASQIAKISPALEEFWMQNSDADTTVIIYIYDRADIASLDQWLTSTQATRQYRHQLVVDELRRVASESQIALRSELAVLQSENRISGFRPYWIVNAITVRAPQNAIVQLAGRAEVEWIEPSFKPSLIEPVDRSRVPLTLDENHGIPTGISAIGAPRVWHELGFTGAGRLVGNIDTGVDGAHPALSARWRGISEPAAECWLDVVRNSTFPEDNSVDGGHGTHVMGTICGNSASSNDSIGVAPLAQWIACNAIDQGSNGGFNNDILDAFEWMADPDGNSATIEDVPDVVHNSWGVDGRFPGYTDCFQLWNDVIVNCEASGVVVTYSAGNEGSTARTLRSPATIELDSVTVFSIGAVNANSDTIPPYTIATFSSRGPTDCPPFTAIKPEVSAPGVDVYSSFPRNNYIRLSGTSMAGPHVAGIVALMREANPNAEVREIKSILMRTAHDFGPEGEDNDYGFGFVDAYEAVLAISLNRAIISGTVTDIATLVPIPNALIRAESRQRTTDESGHYLMSLPGDSTWQLICSRYGYAPDTQEVTIAAAETLIVDFELTSVPQGRITGRTAAGQDVSVRGAMVVFPGLPIAPLTTNDEGRFQIDLPGDSTYTLQFSYDGATAETTVTLATGQEIDLPMYFNSPKSRPDSVPGGTYRAYDLLDTLIPPVFEWIEIAPSRFGAGTALTLQDRDSSAFLAMPFEFRYYSIPYDSLTINENGWVAAGVSHDHSYFNFEIPGASGPSASMSLFWDNLQWIPDTSELCYYYDTELDRLIIEYLDFRFLPGSAGKLNAQVQILDPQRWPTPDGNAEILMLYERIDIPNGATVGIENQTETIGIQTLFNGSYSPSSWTIRPPWAILFTTRTGPYLSEVPNRNPAVADAITVSQAYPNPFNSTTRLTISLSERAFLSVRVFDLLGRQVETLSNSISSPGTHEFLWQADQAAAGLYFIEVKAGQHSSVRKVLLLK